MRLIAKSFLAAAAVLLLLAAALTLGLNLYLHAPGTQEKLQQGISSVIGSPVTIRGMVGFPFGVIRIRGLEMRSKEGGHLLTVEALTLIPNYRSLLHGRIEPSELVLSHPVLRLEPPQSPSPRNDTTQPPVAPLSSQQEPLLPPTAAVPIPDKFPGASIPPRDAALQGLKRLSVNRGEFLLLGNSGRPAIGIEGLTVEATAAADQPWKGVVQARSVLLGSSFGGGGGIRLHDLQAPLSLHGNRSSLTLENFSARLGSGVLEGTVQCELPPTPPSYRATLRLTGASLRDLLADASYGPTSAEGKVGGQLILSGMAGDSTSMEGTGSLLCTETTVQPVDFLKQIGQLLQIEELQLLRLSEARSSFHLSGGQLHLDDLLLRSQNILLTATGPLRPSGNLDLEARLLFNEKMTGRLRGILGPQLTPAPEAGYSQVLFHVSGTPNNPKTDLLERLTGLRIGGDLGGLLQGLFGRPSPQRPPPPVPPVPNR